MLWLLRHVTPNTFPLPSPTPHTDPPHTHTHRARLPLRPEITSEVWDSGDLQPALRDLSRPLSRTPCPQPHGEDTGCVDHAAPRQTLWTSPASCPSASVPPSSVFVLAHLHTWPGGPHLHTLEVWGASCVGQFCCLPWDGFGSSPEPAQGPAVNPVFSAPPASRPAPHSLTPCLRGPSSATVPLRTWEAPALGSWEGCSFRENCQGLGLTHLTAVRLPACFTHWVN